MNHSKTLPLESGYLFHGKVLLKRELLKCMFSILKWLLIYSWKTISKIRTWKSKCNRYRSVKLLSKAIISLMIFLILLPTINIIGNKMYYAAD